MARHRIVPWLARFSILAGLGCHPGNTPPDNPTAVDAGNTSSSRSPISSGHASSAASARVSSSRASSSFSSSSSTSAASGSSGSSDGSSQSAPSSGTSSSAGSSAMPPWTCGLEPTDVQGTPHSHDFTGDGVKDLAWLEQTQVYTQVGRADGGFAPPQLVFPDRWGARIHGIVFSDVNRDGTDDVVLCVSDVSFGGVSLFLGGPAGLGPEQGVGVAGTCEDVAVADINGDGVPDVLAVDETAALKIRPGLADGGFATRFDGGEPLPRDLPRSGMGGSVVVGDMDEDGIKDVATVGSVAGGTSVLDIYLGSQSGGLAHAPPVPTRMVNALGHMEMMQGRTHPSLLGTAGTWPAHTPVFLHGDGHAHFTEELLDVAGRLVDVADADGDGTPDLLVETDLGARVHFQKSTGWEHSALWAIRGAAFVDMDGDGQLDLAGRGWARAMGSQLYHAPAISLLPAGFDRAAHVLNGNTTRMVLRGADGVMLAEAHGVDFTALEPPLVSLTFPAYALHSAAARLAAGPYQGLVLMESAPNSGGAGTVLSTWLGTAQGLSATPAVSGIAASNDGMGVGDVTNDGLDDIILVDATFPSQLVILPSLGDGGVGPAIHEPLDLFGGPDCMVVADFNGDWINDIVLPTGTSVELFLSAPGGGFLHLVRDLEETAYQAYGVDMDGDGDLDLVSTSHDRVWVNPGKGDGTFLARSNVLSNGFPGLRDTFFVDVNGDGRLDMVQRSNALRFIANRGNNVYAELPDLFLDTGPGSGAALGSYFGSGRTDVLTVAPLQVGTSPPAITVTPCERTAH